MIRRYASSQSYNYLDRKKDELALIERGLRSRPPPPESADLDGLLKRKFKSAALCRAELAAQQWSQTETKWKAGVCGSGAFHFEYDYQRADLSVEGPSAYSVRGLENLLSTHYTTSGMAALSSALLAVRRRWPGCRFETRDDGYPETRELIELLGTSTDEDSPHRIVVVDSTIDTLRSARARIDGATAVIFDTSCLAASSLRIRSIVAAVQAQAIPVVLVRSHTKLDCLGMDYGRLGSVVIARGPESGPHNALNCLVCDLIRLTGAAALPLHFPPFAGGEEFRALSRARTAWTMRCTRLIATHVRQHTEVEVKSFAHGLYLVLFPCAYADKDHACAAAEALISRFTASGIPARHAGSFGFDFFGCDWFEDPCDGRIGLRLSVGDLPLMLVRKASRVLGDWLNAPKSAQSDAVTLQIPQFVSGM